MKKYNPDIVGFPSRTTTMLFDIMHLGKIIKKELQKTIIIVGGVHATVEPDSLLDEPYVDYIMRGEGEETFSEFCEVFETDQEELKNLRGVNHNPCRPFVDMTTLKLPNYNLIDIEKYDEIYINLSRGCTVGCTFCYNVQMWGNNGVPLVRSYNTKQIKEIFRNLIEDYNIKNLHIIDDNFLFFKKRAIEVCKFLEQYDITFDVSGRVDAIDDEIVKALKKAGCTKILMGVESGNQRMLDFLKKGVTVEQNIEAIKCCKRNGIFADASMMGGLPTETLEEFEDSFKLIKIAKPDHVSIKPYALLPSALFDYCVAKGWIEKPKTLEEWADWIGGRSWGIRGAGEKHNLSKIPTEVINKKIKGVWEHNFYRRKIKRFIFWVRRGEIKHVIKNIKRIIFPHEGYIKLPFIKMVKLRKSI